MQTHLSPSAAAPPASAWSWTPWIVEAAFGFLIVTPMLFVVQLGSAAPALSEAMRAVGAGRLAPGLRGDPSPH